MWYYNLQEVVFAISADPPKLLFASFKNNSVTDGVKETDTAFQ